MFPGLIGGSGGPAAELLVVLAVMWLLAKAGTELCFRMGLPRVVGELGAGLLLAVLAKCYPGIVPQPASFPGMEYLAEIGIVVLMFAVGLESTVPEMVRVGLPSFRVAVTKYSCKTWSERTPADSPKARPSSSRAMACLAGASRSSA